MMKILVVDDEKDVELLFLQHFRREIKKNNMHFDFAFSGEEALEYLEIHKEETVLILSDINMPGMSGLQLLERIKERMQKPSPRVIMVSAYGDTVNLNSAKELGADDFLTKPIDFKLLKEKLLK